MKTLITGGLFYMSRGVDTLKKKNHCQKQKISWHLLSNCNEFILTTVVSYNQEQDIKFEAFETQVLLESCMLPCFLSEQ